MAEIRAKRKLEEIATKMGNKISAEQLFHIFKNNHSKYSHDKLIEFLRNYIKIHILDGDKLITQYETNVKKHSKTSHEAFIILMNNATVIQQASKPPIAVKPTLPTLDAKLSIKSDFESPALSSTRLENVPTPEIVVSEIKERLAQVTLQQQLQNSSKSSSSTTIRPSLNTSSGSKTIVPKKQTSASKFATLGSINPIATGTFVFNGDVLLPFQKVSRPISGLPTQEQEREIISNLLFTLIGVNAELITPKIKNANNDNYTMVNNNWMDSGRKAVEFEIDELVKESVKDILSDILPLASYYNELQCFILGASKRESGQVLQALAEACGKLIDDYMLTVAQLDSMNKRRELNLHKVLFYLRPIIQTMETVINICNNIQDKNLRGGNVLTMLHDSISLFSGDKNSQEIVVHLTQKAAVPYMEILSLWIFKGIVHDPRNEFFVEDHENEMKVETYWDDYWGKRFVLQAEKVPRFLEKHADMILRTGKYLNVIRECNNKNNECGKRVTFNRSETKLKFSHTDEQNYVNLIIDAYAFASKALMELIMDDYDLMGHFLSVKRYFLLQQGDFIVQFLDACEHELSKGVDEVMPIRLENLLELTLRMSSAKHDKYQDNLSTSLLPFDLVTQMTKINKSVNSSDCYDDYDLPDTSTLSGVECFTFEYKTNWPISIVLSEMTLSKYQIIFRQLFYCKYVENFLCRVWIGNNNAKKFDHGTSEQYRAAFTLRQRMMDTIQNLEYYMMIEVIEPVWLVFMQQITKAKNIDEVLFFHEDFLDHCLKNCMLCFSDILNVMMKICNLCIEFCKFIEEAQKHFIDAELSSMLSKNYVGDDNLSYVDNQDQKDSANAQPETFSEKVSRYDSLFTQQTVTLLIKIHQNAEKHHSEKFVSLIHRINFNNFYSDKLAPIE